MPYENQSFNEYFGSKVKGLVHMMQMGTPLLVI
jgi:hypothetical protein